MPTSTMPPTTTQPLGPVDLAGERAFLGTALNEAVLRVLESGQFILGPEVERFEAEFAKRSRCDHGIGVASGTDALVLGLLAVGVKPGDRVLTSPFTFFASAGTIAWVGATPQLADVELETGLLSPRAAEAAIDDKTACILPVHLYGQLADMRAFRKLANDRGLALLEDGAQAHGASRDNIAHGELGDACTFSFYPSKNLGACGEAGLVVTNKRMIADRLRALRDHGSREKYRHAHVGTNSRMQGFQGAVLNVKLEHLDAWNARRRELAGRYDEAFGGLDALVPMLPAPDSLHVYHQYTVRVLGEGQRDALQNGLRERGIHSAVHYPFPVHMQEAAEAWGYRAGDFPIAEQLSREVLSLPVHPFLTDEDQARIIDATTGLLT